MSPTNRINKFSNNPKSTNGSADQKKKSKRRTKGNPAGSRNVSSETKVNTSTKKGPMQNPKHGSKKEVPLLEVKSNKRYVSPHDELLAIESDSRLNKYLKLLESGKTLKPIEKQYMEARLKRHLLLCELIGVSSNSESENNPFDDLGAVSLKDYMD